MNHTTRLSNARKDSPYSAALSCTSSCESLRNQKTADWVTFFVLVGGIGRGHIRGRAAAGGREQRDRGRERLQR